jgi:type II secretory pathway component GspD/PulD (secretin)
MSLARRVVFSLGLIAYCGLAAAEPVETTAGTTSALGTTRSTAATDSARTTGSAELSEAEEMARIEALPASRIPLKGATLSSAIRMLAESSQLSYLAPPEAEFTERVTSNVMMNPFKLLQVLSENYRFGMDYEHGLWRFYRINLNEMVTKAYTLRFNNLESVSISSSNLSSQLSASSSSSSSTMGSSSGSSGGGSVPTTSFSNTVFTHDSKTSKIIENVRKILTVPTVSTATRELDDSPLNPGAAASWAPQAAPPVEPIWNPDTSQLFVVATRQQHSLVAAYLKTIDRPQKLIKISVKFVETERDPSQSFGANWSQTFLGSGGPVTLSGSPTVSAGQSLAQAVGSGTPLPLATAFNLANPSSTQLPVSTLSAPAFQLTLQAIASDTRSSIVQDPVIFTSSNREVTFKSTTETPIQQGSTTFGSATAATSSTIAYIEIGTQLSVMPNLLPGDGEGKEVVLLNLSINVSAIIGTQTIGGNPYPVTSNRTYSYSVPIENGKTLAIAGLEERTRAVTDSKVPLLGDIPVLGYLFKNRNDAVTHTTLIAFITPDVIEADHPGIDSALPSFRHRVFQGTESESLKQVDESLENLPADIEALRRAANVQNREAVLNRLDRIGVELSLIDVRLGELKLSDHVTGLKSAALERCRNLLDHAREETAKIGHTS